MAPRTSTSAPKPATKTSEPPVAPSAAQQAPYASSIADLELPKTTLAKLAKGSIPDNVKMQQDVVQALLRGSTLFINYLSAAAHDQALSRSGRQITAGDVLKAITELDFGPADALLPILEQELASYRASVAAAKAHKPPPKSRSKKAAAEDGMDVDGEDDGEEEGEEEDGDGDGEEGEDGESEREGEEGEGDGEGDDEEGDEENGA